MNIDKQINALKTEISDLQAELINPENHVAIDVVLCELIEELQEKICYFNEFNSDPRQVRDDEIQDLVGTLQNINFQIAELSRIKENLEPRLAALLNHGEDGSRSYIAGKFKVTVTTGFNYTLNKEEYTINSSRLPQCFNFVKQRVAYDIDKATLRDAEKYASAEELELIASMVSKKAKKLHIKLTAGI